MSRIKGLWWCERRKGEINYLGCRTTGRHLASPVARDCALPEESGFTENRNLSSQPDERGPEARGSGAQPRASSGS